jgi:hypothetical protein
MARVELQVVEVVAPMIVGDVMPERLPEAFGGIGFGIVRGRVHEMETIAVQGEGLAQLRGARRGVDAQVVGENHGDPSPFIRAGDEVIKLLAIDIGRATQGDAVGEPAVAPIKGSEADDFGTLTRSADQALPVVALARPAPGQGRMEADVDLVLDVEIGSWEECKQFCHIRGHSIPELRFEERVPVEGCSGSSRGESVRIGFRERT